MDQIFTKVTGGGMVANFLLRLGVDEDKYVTIERKMEGFVFPITSWQALSTRLPNFFAKYWSFTQACGLVGPEWTVDIHYELTAPHTCYTACEACCI